MKKFSILALVGMFLLSICTFVMAGDVALSGKVDLNWEMKSRDKDATAAVSLENNLQNPDAYNALLTAKAKVNENVTAQISNNFAGFKTTGQEINAQPETFVAVKLGGGELKAGSMVLPGLKEKNTIFNNDVLGCKLSTPMDQISYEGKASVVTYCAAVVGGTIDDKGKPTNDLIVKVGLDDKVTAGVAVDILYYLDVTTKDAGGDAKDSILGLGAGYTIAGATINAQMLSFTKAEDDGLGATLIAGEDDPANEIVVGVGYKIDMANVGLSYNMYGKANNIALTAAAEITKGANLRIRADLPGSDYKDVNPGRSAIGIQLGTEF